MKVKDIISEHKKGFRANIYQRKKQTAPQPAQVAPVKPGAEKKGVAEGFGSNYAEQLAQEVFNHNPNIKDENQVLNLGYNISKNDLGSRAQGIFRDEDFPSDFVSAYFYLQKQGAAENVDIGQEWMSDTELDQYVPDALEQEWRELVGYNEDGNAHPLWINMTGDYEPRSSDPQHRAWMVKVANKWFAKKKIPNVKFFDVRDHDTEDELEWLVQIGQQGVAEAYPGHIQKGKELDAATKKIQANLDKRIKQVDKKDTKEDIAPQVYKVTKNDPNTGVTLAKPDGTQLILPPDKVNAIASNPNDPNKYLLNPDAVAAQVQGQQSGPEIGREVEVNDDSEMPTTETSDEMGDIGGDPTDNYINDIVDKDFEKAQGRDDISMLRHLAGMR